MERLSDFEKALAFTFNNEGGFSNHSADKGGATNMGITQATLDCAYKNGIVTHNSIKHLTKQEASRIYEKNYWNAGKCQFMGFPLNVIHFDTCVLHGKGGAGKILQRALTSFLGEAVEDDGVVGTKTMMCLRRIPEERLAEFTANYYCLKRNQRETSIWVRDKTQRVFKNGWAKRTERCIQYALSNGKRK